jgi:hypothetical protein
MGTELNWLRIGSLAGFYENSYETMGTLKAEN